MKKEIDAIRAKDIAQGGLTQGQQTQIARNEQRISQVDRSFLIFSFFVFSTPIFLFSLAMYITCSFNPFLLRTNTTIHRMFLT